MDYNQITFISVKIYFSQNNDLLRSISSNKLKSSSMLKCITSRIESFSKTFFPYGIDEWNKLLIQKLETSI